VLGATVAGCLLLAACGGSSDGLGEANGGIGAAGDDGPTADTEFAADPAGSQDDGGDQTGASARPKSTSTTEPAGGDDSDRTADLAADRSDEATDPDRVHKALSVGAVPGLAPDDPFQETLAAYWALLHQARQEPWDYDEAELDAVAVGAGRERFLQRVDNLGAAESVVAPSGSRFEVRLSGMRIGSDVAVGEECVLDDFVHVVVRDARTGERYEPPLVTDDRVFTNRYGVTFRFVDGVWKVADRVLIEDGEGVSGCAQDW
jgi:hypothetical protein